MIKQYFVVSTYAASIPEDKDKTEAILDTMANELASVSKEQLRQYLGSVFDVIEGDEIDVEEVDED